MAGGGIVSAYHVVSLSGGKDSTAMLIMMLERGMPVDEVVWFDTGWEFPAMVGHIGKVEAETGVPVTRLRPDLPFNYWMFDHVRMKGARAGEAGYGWARMGSRWCTKIKTSAIDRHVKAMAGRRRVVQYVGIAADEAHRAKGKRYPLVEWGVTEAEALAYCRARGYDWGGLYDRFDRVSCWCAPCSGSPTSASCAARFLISGSYCATWTRAPGTTSASIARSSSSSDGSPSRTARPPSSATSQSAKQWNDGRTTEGTEAGRVLPRKGKATRGDGKPPQRFYP